MGQKDQATLWDDIGFSSGPQKIYPCVSDVKGIEDVEFRPKKPRRLFFHGGEPVSHDFFSPFYPYLIVLANFIQIYMVDYKKPYHPSPPNSATNTKVEFCDLLVINGVITPINGLINGVTEVV